MYNKANLEQNQVFKEDVRVVVIHVQLLLEQFKFKDSLIGKDYPHFYSLL